MANPHSRRRRWVHACYLTCLCGILTAGACTRPTKTQPRTNSTSFTVDDILRRCVAVHRSLDTLQAKGLLRDYRSQDRRVATISWDFLRPGRCRLQIDLDLALISKDRWWRYDSDTGRYRGYQHFTKTPLETPAYLLSRGVPFLLPVLFNKNRRALMDNPARGFADWSMEGVEWHAERPCYLVSRPGLGKNRGTTRRVWIDQDHYLVRGWALVVRQPDGRVRTVMGCSYYDLLANKPLALDLFQLKPPEPILLSLPDSNPPPPTSPPV